MSGSDAVGWPRSDGLEVVPFRNEGFGQHLDGVPEVEREDELVPAVGVTAQVLQILQLFPSGFVAAVQPVVARHGDDSDGAGIVQLVAVMTDVFAGDLAFDAGQPVGDRRFGQGVRDDSQNAMADVFD